MRRNDHMKERLQAARRLLAGCSEGREVLETIKKLGIKFRIVDLGETTCGVFHPQVNTVDIHQGLSDFEMASALAHETRHAWQFNVLGWFDRLGSFERIKTLVSVSRMFEGDAYAFQGIVEDALKAGNIENPDHSKAQKYLEYFLLIQNYQLDGYDDRRFSGHSDYVSAYLTLAEAFSLSDSKMAKDFFKSAFNHKLKLKELRKLCVTGFDLNQENYLSTMSADDLWSAIHMREDGTSSIHEINRISKEQAGSYRKIYNHVKSARQKSLKSS